MSPDSKWSVASPKDPANGATGAESPDAEGYYSNENATFGDRLAAARQAAGLSRDELADRLGVVGDLIAEWEEDRSEPRANSTVTLAGMLNVSMSWLLIGAGEGVTPPELAGRAQRGEHPIKMALLSHDLETARRFYRDTLGCAPIGAGSDSQEFNFFGHHLVLRLAPEFSAAGMRITVGNEPAPNFGVVLGWESWRLLVDRLRDNRHEFLIDPSIQDVGAPGERSVFCVEDPSGNALCFRAYREVRPASA